MFIGMGFLHKTKNCAYFKNKEKSWLVSWKGSSHYLKKEVIVSINLEFPLSFPH